VLEEFFNADLSLMTFDNHKNLLRQRMQSLFLSVWQASRAELNEFALSSDQEKFYFSETMLMLFNWLEQFLAKIQSSPDQSFADLFKKLTPIREREYTSPELYVRGFIDAIEDGETGVCIMDYKTNTYLEITDEQRLQLAIYALLYKRTHGVTPAKAGIFFLRSRPKFISVDSNLLSDAEREIFTIHEKTQTTEINDYPLKPGPLCKTCDFYKICFEQKTIKEYRSDTRREVPAQKLQG
jgi:CRISPR/Cas system-associated exonuclease Cas4 (RecB family)